MKADRNLLFGVLARQCDCITAAQLALAQADLAAGSGKSLDDVLAAKGWITGSQRSEIDRVLEGLLQMHGGDCRRALEAIGGVQGETTPSPIDSPNPQTQVEETIDSEDPAVKGEKPAREGDAGSSSGTSEGTSDITADSVAKGEPQPLETIDYEPEYRSRYSLTRVEGEGGYGQVWLAYDPNLKREIALKNIRPDLIDELEGMAEGTGLRLEEHVLITLHEELWHRGVIPSVDHCTAVAVGPPATRDGHTYVGESWDWFAELYGKSQMLRWRRGTMTRVYYGTRERTRTPAGQPIECHPQCARMRELLDGAKGRIDLATFQRFFGDHQTRWICKHFGSLDAMVFDTTSRRAHVTRGPGCLAQWKTFAFEESENEPKTGVTHERRAKG